MNKKLLGIFLIVIVVGVVVYNICSYDNYNKIMYPKPLVTGDGNIKIACVGDSITYGLGVINDRSNSWCSLVQKRLGEDYQTINYGLSNRTLLKEGNVSYTKEDMWNKFLSSNSDIILFMLGTNDSKEINWNKNKFKIEYEEIVSKLKSLDNNPKIYIMVPPSVYIDYTSRGDPNNKTIKEDIMPIIKDIGDRLNVEVIDLYTFTANNKSWFGDGIHPNKEGNKEIAEFVSKKITNELKYNLIKDGYDDIKNTIIDNYSDYLEILSKIEDEDYYFDKLKYDEDYFKCKSLAIININTGSSMNKFLGVEFYIEDNTLYYVTNIEYSKSKIVTTDINGVIYAIEVDKVINEIKKKGD